MSFMQQEILEIPEVILRQLHHNTPALEQLCEKLRARPPSAILTVARGSSDHAALFMKYLWETQFGLIVSSVHPSVYTLYQAPMQVSNSIMIALSQSGQGPDICEVIRYGREHEAFTLALVNQTDSPLAAMAEYLLPLHCGPEQSVAATKSYVAMLLAALHFTAIFKQDKILLQALYDLPTQIEALAHYRFDHLFPLYEQAVNALIIGRGFGLSIAEEIALKFKEVTQIHAESFSGAEVLHGPFSLFHEALPVFIFMQNDAILGSLRTLIAKIRTTQVAPVLIGDKTALAGNEDLEHILLPEVHPLLTPILTVFIMYRFIEQLAMQKKLNPDTPPLIQKVTKTV